MMIWLRYLLGRGSEKAGPRLSDNLLPFIFSAMLFVKQKTKPINQSSNETVSTMLKAIKRDIKSIDATSKKKGKKKRISSMLHRTEKNVEPMPSFHQTYSYALLIFFPQRISMAHPRYGIAAYLIFPIGALHMKTPPQTLTISSKAVNRLLAIGDIDTLTSHVYDRPLAINPPKKSE